jgi:hypothetical protein
MTTKIVRNKRLTLFFSWFGGLVAVMAIAFLAIFAYYAGDFGQCLNSRFLHPALLVAAGYTVIWIFTGWIHVAEGTFRLAEYGGRGNGLQRIHFGDGEKWQLTEPVHIPLEFNPPPHCIVILLVEENFLGWTRFRFRYFSLRYGCDIPPWSKDGKEDPYQY